MEDTGTTAVSDGDQVPASRAEVIDAIDDTIVRRMVRLAVHVRGYAPYYAVTVVLFAFLAFGPRPDSSSGSDAAMGASATSTPGGGSGAATGGGARSHAGAPALSPAAAGALVAGAAGFGDVLSPLGGSAGGTLSDGSTPMGPELPAAPGADVPDFGDFDDFDTDTPDVPEACTVALPSPAPGVSPAREVDGAHTTAEAAAGVELPADAAPYADDAARAAGCPDVERSLPDLPLPVGLPV